jgi:ribosomal-protein-alanine N-acetyltransferase
MKTKTKTPKLVTKCGQPIRIRWMIRSDMPEVLEIERAAFRHPWNERHFIQACSSRTTSIMVAETDGKDGSRIVGFVAYAFDDDKFDVLNLAVCPYCRRRGIGRLLIESLIDKLTPDGAGPSSVGDGGITVTSSGATFGGKRRQRLQASVWEGNTDAQLFFRAMGMTCVAILKGAYAERGDDGAAYLFTRSKEAAATLPSEVL